MENTLVIIPTYNEIENIASIIAAVFDTGLAVDVLIVDDQSPDGTAQEVINQMDSYPERLFLETKSKKEGLGAAYVHGFLWALRRQYEYIFEMDADFSHDPADLERLYTACINEGADLAVGSRYVKGGKLENWPVSRKLISACGALFSKLITWLPVNDPTAGFVCYRNRVLSKINLSAISFVGYAFQIEMKFAAWRLGFKIKEVPITFRDRKYGASKMSKGIISEGIKGVLYMQVQYLFGDYLKRISRPV